MIEPDPDRGPFGERIVRLKHESTSAVVDYSGFKSEFVFLQKMFDAASFKTCMPRILSFFKHLVHSGTEDLRTILHNESGERNAMKFTFLNKIAGTVDCTAWAGIPLHKAWKGPIRAVPPISAWRGTGGGRSGGIGE